MKGKVKVKVKVRGKVKGKVKGKGTECGSERWPVVEYQLSGIGYWLLVTGYLLLGTDDGRQTADRRTVIRGPVVLGPVIGYWLLVIGELTEGGPRSDTLRT